MSHAKKSLQMGAAQQAAEMAAKGLHMELGQIAWSDSLLDLLAALPEGSRPDRDFLENAHPAGGPSLLQREGGQGGSSILTVSVKVWKINREAILARLRQWADQLKRDENVLAIVLFGSLARGDQTGASDADILIILGDSPLRFDERIPASLPSGIGIGVEAFPYTLGEVRKRLEEGWGGARVALEDGPVLFERGSALEDLQLKARRERPHTDG